MWYSRDYISWKKKHLMVLMWIQCRLQNSSVQLSKQFQHGVSLPPSVQSHNLSFSNLPIMWYQHLAATSIFVLHHWGTFVRLSVTSAFTHCRLTVKINYTPHTHAALLPFFSKQIKFNCGGFSHLVKEIMFSVNTQIEPHAPVSLTVKPDVKTFKKIKVLMMAIQAKKCCLI